MAALLFPFLPFGSPAVTRSANNAAPLRSDRLFCRWDIDPVTDRLVAVWDVDPKPEKPVLHLRLVHG